MKKKTVRGKNRTEMGFFQGGVCGLACAFFEGGLVGNDVGSMKTESNDAKNLSDAELYFQPSVG